MNFITLCLRFSYFFLSLIFPEMKDIPIIGNRLSVFHLALDLKKSSLMTTKVLIAEKANETSEFSASIKNG